MVDLGVPRNVEPSAADLDGLVLLDMEALRSAVSDALSGREEEVADADRIVADEVERYRVASRARDAAPMVSALRARVEEARRSELDRQRSKRSELSDAAVGTGRCGDQGDGGQAAPSTDRGPQGRGRDAEGRAPGRSAPNAVRPLAGGRPVSVVTGPIGAPVGHPGFAARPVAGAPGGRAPRPVGGGIVPGGGRDHRATGGLDVPLDRLGGQGVFVKEVQAAVIGGEADAAVHSAKDLPPRPSSAYPAWCWPRSPSGPTPATCWWAAGSTPCPSGPRWPPARPGAGSSWPTSGPTSPSPACGGTSPPGWPRSGAAEVAAVVVAKAALDRLGWTPPTGARLEVLEPETMLPQVGQGALAVECREDDEATRRALAAIDDPGDAPPGHGRAGLPGRAGGRVHAAGRCPCRSRPQTGRPEPMPAARSG